MTVLRGNIAFWQTAPKGATLESGCLVALPALHDHLLQAHTVAVRTAWPCLSGTVSRHRSIKHDSGCRDHPCEETRAPDSHEQCFGYKESTESFESFEIPSYQSGMMQFPSVSLARCELRSVLSI